MKTYLFDLGNSTHGPIGGVIEVRARDQREALAAARQVAYAADDVPIILDTPDGQARIYLNASYLAQANISVLSEEG